MQPTTSMLLLAGFLVVPDEDWCECGGLTAAEDTWNQPQNVESDDGKEKKRKNTKETWYFPLTWGFVLSSYMYHNLHTKYSNKANTQTYINRYIKMIAAPWLEVNWANER